MGSFLSYEHSPQFHFRFKLKTFSILQFPFRMRPGIIFDFVSGLFWVNLFAKGLRVGADGRCGWKRQLKSVQQW